MRDGSSDAGVLPAPFQGPLLVVLCVVLTLLLTLARFPFERVEPALRGLIAQATGARVTMDSLALRPSLGLVAVRAGTVELAWPGGTSVQAEQITLRPAWSTSWLRGQPAVHLSARNGSVTPSNIPLPVPFERLSAGVSLPADGAELSGFSLDGPLVALEAAGTVTASALEIDGVLRAQDPNMGALLAPLGIRLDEDGAAPLKLRGSPSRPLLR